MNEKLNKKIGDLSDIDVTIGGPPCQGFHMLMKKVRERMTIDKG